MKVGDKVKCKATRVLSSGVSVDLIEHNAKGWIRKRDLSWFHDVRPTSSLVKVNEQFDSIILEIDPKTNFTYLSLREAIGNPWSNLKKSVGIGRIVEGLVTKLYHDGAYILLPKEGVEGFVPIEQIDSKIKNPEEAILPGDQVLCCIKEIDVDRQEIILSISEAITKINMKKSSWNILAETYNQANIKHLQEKYGGTGLDVTKDEKANEEAYISNPINKILIVEDEDEVRIGLEKILDRMGYTIKSCSNGEDSIELFKEFKPDLILMDKNLPGEDGIITSRKILKIGTKIPIVICTGESDLRLPEIEELGCGLLIKPIGRSDLEQIISDASTNSLKIRITDNDNGQTIDEFGKNSHESKTMKESIEDILNKSEYNLGADVVAVFSIDLTTYQVNLIASSKDISINYNEYRQKLIYSPIKDVILDHISIVENDANSDESKGKFRHLLDMLGFCSFIGVPIKTNALEIYGLFYFHQAQDKFIVSEYLSKAKLVAEILKFAIEKKIVENQIDISQRLIFAGEMSYSLRHEIRNLLMPITTNIDILKMDADDIDKKIRSTSDEDFIKRFVSTANVIYDVKNKIVTSLDVFKSLVTEESGENKENINSIASLVIQILTQEANLAKARLNSDFDDSIPLLTISRTKLQQIFINILLNAIQWVGINRNKGGEITIQTRYVQNDEFPIQIRFIDNGPGIHRLNWERIFEPLVTARKEGSGMGLFVCRSLARAINAKVYVEKSAIFFGTTFRVDIAYKEE